MLLPVGDVVEACLPLQPTEAIARDDQHPRGGVRGFCQSVRQISKNIFRFSDFVRGGHCASE